MLDDHWQSYDGTGGPTGRTRLNPNTGRFGTGMAAPLPLVNLLRVVPITCRAAPYSQLSTGNIPVGLLPLQPFSVLIAPCPLEISAAWLPAGQLLWPEHGCKLL